MTSRRSITASTMPVMRPASVSVNRSSKGDAASSSSTIAPIPTTIPTISSSSQRRKERLVQPSRKPSRQVGACPVSSIWSTLRISAARDTYWTMMEAITTRNSRQQQQATMPAILSG